jgi:hypothetical protein
MDTDTAESSSTPVRASRSKTEILMEAHGTTDRNELYKMLIARTEESTPLPPLETWSTLKLPYQLFSNTPLFIRDN